MKLIVVVILVTTYLRSANTIRCDRSPEGFSANKSPTDGRFLIKIAGNPEMYAAGETYTSK